MKNEILLALVRHGLGFLAAYLVAKGVLSAENADSLTSVLTQVIGGTALGGGALIASIVNKKGLIETKPVEKVVLQPPPSDVRPPKGYYLSDKSLSILNQVDVKLKTLFTTAIIDSPYDFICYHGLRTDEQQREMIQSGASRVKHSKHQDGRAVDFGIWKNGKIDWDNYEAYTAVANHIKNVAVRLNIDIVWGGDWPNFKDFVHIELA